MKRYIFRTSLKNYLIMKRTAHMLNLSLKQYITEYSGILGVCSGIQIM